MLSDHKIFEELRKKKPDIARVMRPVLMLAAAMLAFTIISYTGLRLMFPGYGNVDKTDYSDIIYQFDEYDLIEQLAGEADDLDYVPDAEKIIEYLVDNEIETSRILEYIN